MILGIVGTIGSGKDAASDYISQKYGYELVSFRNIVHDTVVELGYEPNRENLQRIGREYRNKYGEDYFAKKALEKGKLLLSQGKKVLFKEMRTLRDVEVLIEEFHKKIFIIKIDASDNVRFDRLKNRGRIGDPQSIEDYKKQSQREIDIGFTESFKFASVTIENNSTLEDLYNKIDWVMNQ